MEKKSQDFSMEDAARLAQTPAAKQLMAALSRQDPAALDRAMANAAAGNFDQVQQDLATLMGSPEIKALLRQLGG